MALASHAIPSMAGAWGGWRSQEPVDGDHGSIRPRGGELAALQDIQAKRRAVGAQGNLNRGQGGAGDGGIARVGHRVRGEGNGGVRAGWRGKVGIGVAVRPAQITALGDRDDLVGRVVVDIGLDGPGRRRR
jgi:hypothetical protein